MYYGALTLWIKRSICVPMVATTSVLMAVPNGKDTRVGLLIAFYGTFWFKWVQFQMRPSTICIDNFILVVSLSSCYP